MVRRLSRSSSRNEIPLDNQYLLPPEFYLHKFEKMYKLKELNNEQIYDSILDFFKAVSVDDTLKAVYCRKLGTWLSENIKDDS